MDPQTIEFQLERLDREIRSTEYQVKVLTRKLNRLLAERGAYLWARLARGEKSSCIVLLRLHSWPQKCAEWEAMG